MSKRGRLKSTINEERSRSLMMFRLHFNYAQCTISTFGTFKAASLLSYFY